MIHMQSPTNPLKSLQEQMMRIRALGSMLVGAAIASDEFHDWHSIGITGKMLVDEAEQAQLTLDECEVMASELITKDPTT